MIDERLYREAFSRLRASDEAKKEVLLKMSEMNEKKTMKRPLKALRVLAMAAVLTLALAVTANAASGGELLEGIYQTFVVTFTTTTVDGDGTIVVNVSDDVLDSAVEGLIFPEHGAAFTEKRDGRLFLIIDDAETDITDALNEEGQYSAYLEDGTTIIVQGTVEDHMILSSAKDSDMYYITTHGDVNALNGAEAGQSEMEDVTAGFESMKAADASAD